MGRVVIPDQRSMWDTKHKNGDHKTHRGKPTSFSQVAKEYFSKSAKVLELGCGVGSDSIYFADNGFKVIATDFSSEVIKQNTDNYIKSDVEYSVLDMSAPLPFKQDNFDVVYSHLALHYYDHETTSSIVTEVHRVLKTNGVFAFACKSTSDPHFGEGEQVEKDVFISPKGHARHFFSIDYTRSLLNNLFSINMLKEIKSDYPNDKSVFIYCVALKKP